MALKQRDEALEKVPDWQAVHYATLKTEEKTAFEIFKNQLTQMSPSQTLQEKLNDLKVLQGAIGLAAGLTPKQRSELASLTTAKLREFFLESKQKDRGFTPPTKSKVKESEAGIAP